MFLQDLNILVGALDLYICSKGLFVKQ